MNHFVDKQNRIFIHKTYETRLRKVLKVYRTKNTIENEKIQPYDEFKGALERNLLAWADYWIDRVTSPTADGFGEDFCLVAENKHYKWFDHISEDPEPDLMTKSMNEDFSTTFASWSLYTDHILDANGTTMSPIEKWNLVVFKVFIEEKLKTGTVQCLKSFLLKK